MFFAERGVCMEAVFVVPTKAPLAPTEVPPLCAKGTAGGFPGVGGCSPEEWLAAIAERKAG